MTKNASDLFKAVVQHPLEKDTQPVARESAVVQDAGVNAPIPRNKLAVKPGKKAIHELRSLDAIWVCWPVFYIGSGH